MRKADKRVLAVLLMVAANYCWAEQRKDARDGDTVEAKISQSAPTRIRVAGAKITDVVGNIQSASNCDQSSSEKTGQGSAPSNSVGSGDLVVSCDLRKGEVYVRPANPALSIKAKRANQGITLFVSTELATYTLLLTPVAGPVEGIVVLDPMAFADGRGDDRSAQTPEHVRVLKSMLRAMTSSKPARDLRITQSNEVLPLWSEANFTLRRTFTGRGMVGSSYVLTNISKAPMVLAEPEFDGEGVLAVAIETMNLRPGETSWVHIIRSGE